MEPGTPFGPGIRALLAYLHHSHHVSFERVSRIASELFGLSISQGAIANAFRRMEADMAMATRAITDKLLTARVIASDETTTRINGIIHWQWVFLSKEAVLHRIARRRARSVAEEVLGGHQPDVWIFGPLCRTTGTGQGEPGLPRQCPARRSIRHRLR